MCSLVEVIMTGNKQSKPVTWQTLITTSCSMISCQIFYQNPSLHLDFCRASRMYGALKCTYVKKSGTIVIKQFSLIQLLNLGVGQAY